MLGIDVHVNLPDGLHAAAAARRRIVSGLRARGMRHPSRLDEAVLVATELAANAVRHAGGCLAVVVSCTDDGVTVAALDSSPVRPRRRDPRRSRRSRPAHRRSVRHRPGRHPTCIRQARLGPPAALSITHRHVARPAWLCLDLTEPAKAQRNGRRRSSSVTFRNDLDPLRKQGHAGRHRQHSRNPGGGRRGWVPAVLIRPMLATVRVHT